MHHARTSAQERSGLGPRALAVEQALSADFTSQKREVHTVRFGSISLDDTHFHFHVPAIRCRGCCRYVTGVGGLRRLPTSAPERYPLKLAGELRYT